MTSLVAEAMAGLLGLSSERHAGCGDVPGDRVPDRRRPMGDVAFDASGDDVRWTVESCRRHRCCRRHCCRRRRQVEHRGERVVCV